MYYLCCTKFRAVDKESLAEGEEVEMKVLVAKGSKPKTVFAHAVDANGSEEDGYAVPRLVEEIARAGHTKIILKSDNEPASLKVLKDRCRTARVEVEEPEQTQEEQAAKYDPRSNADVGNAARQAAKLLRTLKLSFEKKREEDTHIAPSYDLARRAHGLVVEHQGDGGRWTHGISPRKGQELRQEELRLRGMRDAHAPRQRASERRPKQVGPKMGGRVDSWI